MSIFFYDPADTPDSPVYFCEMSGVNFFLFDICTGQHRTSDNCPVQYFFDRDFCTEHNENVRCSSFISPKYTGHIFARKSFMSGVKKYKTNRTSICPVSNRLFFDTGHPHRTIRCIGRVVFFYVFRQPFEFR